MSEFPHVFRNAPAIAPEAPFLTGLGIRIKQPVADSDGLNARYGVTFLNYTRTDALSPPSPVVVFSAYTDKGFYYREFKINLINAYNNYGLSQLSHKAIIRVFCYAISIYQNSDNEIVADPASHDLTIRSYDFFDILHGPIRPHRALPENRIGSTNYPVPHFLEIHPYRYIEGRPFVREKDPFP